MHDFNKNLECSECGSDQWQRFADLEGNGVKCTDCLHKYHVFKPKAKERKVDKRKRMTKAWSNMKKRARF